MAMGPVWGMLALCVSGTLCSLWCSLPPLLMWPSLAWPLLVEKPFSVHPCSMKAFAGGL